MGQLDHDSGTGLVAVIGQSLHPRDNFVFPGEDIVKGWWRIARHGGRPCSHCQPDTRFSTLQVVKTIAILRHPVFGISRFMTGRHDPVAKCQMLELERLEKRVTRHFQDLRGLKVLGILLTPHQKICQTVRDHYPSRTKKQLGVWSMGGLVFSSRLNFLTFFHDHHIFSNCFGCCHVVDNPARNFQGSRSNRLIGLFSNMNFLP